MSHYVPLSRATHRHTSIVPQGYGFAAQQPVVPVVVDELAELVPTIPLALVASEDRSRFQLVALQALDAGNNAYIHTNGSWILGYRPAWYRSYPFRLLRPAEASASVSQRVLCIDADSPGIVEHAEQESAIACFDAEGELSPHLQRLMAFLEQFERAQDVTNALVAQLEQHALIVPWTITLTLEEGKTPLGGIYHIDERALRALSGEALSELASSGALALAYAQLMSEHRLPVIEKLYALRHEAQSRDGDSVDPEFLFDEGGDLSFNFDD